MSNPFHGNVAQNYDSFFETPFGKTVFKLEREVLLEILSPLRGSSFLEIGCGTGVWMDLLKREGFGEPVGVDISLDMLFQAREKGLSNLVNGTALMLPFPDNSFDVSCFITSLEFITDRKRAFLEAVRVSRRNILVAFLNRFSALNLYRQLKSFFSGKSIYSSRSFLTKGELEHLARYARKIGRKRVYLEKFFTTLNLTIGNFTNEQVERKLGFKLPTGAFGVALFKVEQWNW